ncbi:MAG: hypothetical protein IPL26_15370 [Leptospiraceae bacterium]|nr:hypothetical protein [Leptospiraceae bacterium]
MLINIQNFINLIHQLVNHLQQVSEISYSEKLSLFGGSSIGEHVRHIYNFPECLLKGIQSGKVNYDNRTRDTKLETNRDYAIRTLLDQADYILNLNHYMNRQLILETGLTISNPTQINTNLERELHYITEHTIHHMAILRMGFNFHFPDMKIEESFGFAYSTIEYKNLSK